MIDGGTFHVGLTVMNFIVSLISGVCMFGLPTTTRVCQATEPFFTTFNVKSGMFRIEWLRPRSCGIQRQRSMRGKDRIDPVARTARAAVQLADRSRTGETVGR